MRDAEDYVLGELEDGPCRHSDHELARVSLEAFKVRTREPRWEWHGCLYANCARGCGSTIAIELKTKETT